MHYSIEVHSLLSLLYKKLCDAANVVLAHRFKLWTFFYNQSISVVCGLGLRVCWDYVSSLTIQFRVLYNRSTLTVCQCSCRGNSTLDWHIEVVVAVVFAPTVVIAVSQWAFPSTAADIIHENCTFSGSIKVTNVFTVVSVSVQKYVK